MGLCHSEEDKTGFDKSKAIDRQIKQGAANDERTVKLLLLGAGECGKSTVLKQMRILHNNGFTDDEVMQQKRVVYNNTVTAMHQLIKAMQQYQIKYTSPEREADAHIVQDVIKQGRESDAFTPELAVAIKVVFFQQCVLRYFLMNLEGSGGEMSNAVAVLCNLLS
ncbi:unnamed protein product [Heligmosomoides polygyrus]|uniref:G-protein alpha subunit n=1 Tax=Heligmosomoides polygyrus TaxID=6339 RepID=A0A183FGQ0_HELPZ|nr:unnamed protein product [Heligmosomoides polygyrus]